MPSAPGCHKTGGVWLIQNRDGEVEEAREGDPGGISITPQLTGTDGFYIVQFQRGSE